MKLTVHGSSGPLVVKISGIAGGVRLYDEEVAAAVAAGFRVVALDTTGDRHDDPAAAPLTWDLLASEVVAAIDRAGGGKAVLWGTSFGCLIALAAAARHPERVSGLLLCHPPDPLRRTRLELALTQWADRRRNPDLAARVLFSIAFVGMTAWEALPPSFWPRAPHLLRSALEARTPSATVRQKLNLLFFDDPGAPPPGAGIPAEIVAGAWDLVAPLPGALRVAARIPGCVVHVMGYSGHAGGYTRAKAYARLATGALARLS